MEPPEPPSQAPSRGEGQHEGPGPASAAAILIADDDAATVLALRDLLASDDCRVVTAGSGDEALRCVLRQDFAAILLDARMPGVDGFETARLVRERERSRHTPIIFLTGAYEDHRSVFRGYEAGAVDYLVKPVVPEVLKSKVAVFVELYRKNTALMLEVGERKRAQERLRASEENLRALAARLQLVREEERTRIAREIHDELGQALTGLKMELNTLSGGLKGAKKPLADQALLERMKSMSGLIDDAIQNVRKIASLLRPVVLDQLGLAAAMGWQAGEFQMRTGIRCRLALPAEPVSVDAERSTAAFRIFQELLTNVARHSAATRVDIGMRLEPGRLVFEVSDNGRGMGPVEPGSTKSLGLLGMRERALQFGGRVDFEPAAGGGTCAIVSIPLANP